MAFREQPIVEAAVLPDGRPVRVRVGVPDDPYVDESLMDTVTVEVFAGDEPLATVTTALDADVHDEEARRLAADVRQALESGRVEPTSAGIEPLALRGA